VPRIVQFLLYRGKKAPHGPILAKLQPYGKPEEETSAQDEQAQASQALEVAPPPEAHLAEVGAPSSAVTFDEHFARRRVAAGFRFSATRAGCGGAKMGQMNSSVAPRGLGRAFDLVTGEVPLRNFLVSPILSQEID
jgi:hypothetical protein